MKWLVNAAKKEQQDLCSTDLAMRLEILKKTRYAYKLNWIK